MNAKLSRRNLWAYPVGSIGRDMAVGMFSGYLLTYVLFTKNLTGAQFAALSVIMMAARIFDAFNDPVMGNIIEATRTRFGKFKPWIAVGCVLSIVVIIFSFTNPFQGWTYVVTFGILYFAYSIVFTMNDIAYWGMVPALARQAQDRNRLTSRTVFFAGGAVSGGHHRADVHGRLHGHRGKRDHGLPGSVHRDMLLVFRVPADDRFACAGGQS